LKIIFFLSFLIVFGNLASATTKIYDDLNVTGSITGGLLTAISCDLKAFTNGTIYCGSDATGGTTGGGGANVSTTTCSGTNKVSAINNLTGLVTCSADVDTSNTTTEVRNAINSTGLFYNITSGDLQCSNCISGTEILESGLSIPWTTITGHDLNVAWSNKLGYNNITSCADTEILKMSGSSWACGSDLTGGGGSGANYWQVGGGWMFPNTTAGGDNDVNVTNFNATNIYQNFLKVVSNDTSYYQITVADLACANCIGGTEIDESTLSVPWASVTKPSDCSNSQYAYGIDGASLDCRTDLTNTTTEVRNAINSTGLFYNIISGDLQCSNCIGGTEITESTLVVQSSWINTTEEMQDAAGALLGGTETLITVTYDDANGDIDFVVNNDLHLYSWTNVVDADITDTLTASNVEGTDLGTLTNGYYCTYDLTGTEIDCNSQYTTASDLICTNCIGGTEIAELADADISNTLTASILAASANADLNDNDILDVKDIGSTTDELSGNVYIGDDLKIYFGADQDVFILFNTTINAGQLG